MMSGTIAYVKAERAVWWEIYTVGFTVNIPTWKPGNIYEMFLSGKKSLITVLITVKRVIHFFSWLNSDEKPKHVFTYYRTHFC